MWWRVVYLRLPTTIYTLWGLRLGKAFERFEPGYAYKRNVYKKTCIKVFQGGSPDFNNLLPCFMISGFIRDFSRNRYTSRNAGNFRFHYKTSIKVTPQCWKRLLRLIYLDLDLKITICSEIFLVLLFPKKSGTSYYNLRNFNTRDLNNLSAFFTPALIVVIFSFAV